MSRIEPPPDDNEVSRLIRTLRLTDERLAALTAGQVDSVVDREGNAFLLRGAQVSQRESDAAKQASILNALPANIALVDSRGFIVSVNGAWRKFADENGYLAGNYGIGSNYLTSCEVSGGDQSADARAVSTGIRSVLAGQSNHFVFGDLRDFVWVKRVV